MLDGKLNSVLIVSYRRHENLKKIIDRCIENGISNLFVAIDGPKNSQGVSDYNKMIEIVKLYIANKLSNVQVLVREKNLGCAVNLISACDWFFSQNEYGAVLEDDCIPSNDFFLYLREIKDDFQIQEDVMIACGTQFAPNQTRSDSCFISSYPLSWGWASTATKWIELSEIFKSRKRGSFSFRAFYDPEYCFWKAAERRARNGFTDVWDSILVSYFYTNNKYAILPRNNLVLNVGTDKHATHTKEQSNFLNAPTGIFKRSAESIVFYPEATNWLKINFYKIRVRHLFSTKITYLLDKTLPNKRFEDSLETRLSQVLKV